ncbi:MAG: ABC transporter ATP-binding protein [Acidobacteria bacterium]|nr:ABC transporter ATP-binding protein [Acidobacteriota bacterium]MBI3656969.1 ABC transporter ATP-binding protein [Acidobacteriota bacterium]
MIRLVNVSLKVGAFALHSINLEVKRGEYFVILGPTGAGKTKLLEIIAGLLFPSSGEVWIAGENVTERPPERRCVGLMYQDHLLFPHLRVRQNIAFGLRGRSPAETRTKIASLARLLKIEHLLECRITGLSGGEQQRIALARALAPERQVLLLDEPLSALDPPNRREVRRELRALHKQLAMTTLHVTHDFEEALVLADRVAVIQAGEIVQIGPPEIVFRQPKSTFVAEFLGVENLFRGEITDCDKSQSPHEKIFNARFQAGPLRLSVVAEREGPAYAAIRSEEIIVSRDQPHSSALNNLYGTVTHIETTGPLVRLTLDVGVPLMAMLTVQSFAVLGLEVGTKAYLSFKATAIHVF